MISAIIWIKMNKLREWQESLQHCLVTRQPTAWDNLIFLSLLKLETPERQLQILFTHRSEISFSFHPMKYEKNKSFGQWLLALTAIGMIRGWIPKTPILKTISKLPHSISSPQIQVAVVNFYSNTRESLKLFLRSH